MAKQNPLELRDDHYKEQLQKTSPTLANLQIQTKLMIGSSWLCQRHDKCGVGWSQWELALATAANRILF